MEDTSQDLGSSAHAYLLRLLLTRTNLTQVQGRVNMVTTDPVYCSNNLSTKQGIWQSDEACVILP